MGFIALIRRELANAFLHDARRAIFLFGAATAYLILFGILYYPGVVKEIPTVVCDEEHTAYSRLLTRQVDDDERLGLVRVVADEGEARDMLRRKEVYAAVIIPADFSHDILNGRSAKVLFMLNGANIITTNIATTAGNDIVNTFNTRFAARQAALRTSGDEQMLKKRISPVETTLRVLNNPTQSYMMFFVTGLAMAAMQRAFFSLLKKVKSGDYSSKAVRLPYYREKGGLFNLILSTNAITIKNSFLTVPMSREYMKRHHGHRIRIPVPDRLKDKTIQEVRICPMYGGRYFKIQYCYLQDPEPVKTSPDRVLAIDLGLDNLAACVTNTGTSFLMDGRKLKSINQYWNKRKARLQSIAAKQGQNTTNQLCQLAKKCNFRMQDILRKTARYILDFCISHQIGTLVCGYNRDFKRGLKLGKVTNQHFTQISLSYLRSTLKHLCERYGITYLEQEESYTSQASCLDLDDIPVYQPDTPYTGTFSGQRVRRGLYRFANGRTANADINGAANILRKSKQNFDFEGLCKGLLDSPLRIRLS